MACVDDIVDITPVDDSPIWNQTFRTSSYMNYWLHLYLVSVTIYNN